jgi:hypothetical protein
MILDLELIESNALAYALPSFRVVVQSHAERMAIAAETCAFPLIRIKIYRSRISGDLVSRPRLQEWLDRRWDRALPRVVAAVVHEVCLVRHWRDNWLIHERVLIMDTVLGILLAALAVQLVLVGLADVGVVTLSGGHRGADERRRTKDDSTFVVRPSSLVDNSLP